MFNRKKWLNHRIIIGALIISLILVLWLSGIKNCLTFEQIKKNSMWLHQQVHEHYWRTVVLYISTFVVVVIACLPGAALMSIVGGYLFGVSFGVLYLTIGATLGAFLFFMFVRYVLGIYLQERYAHRLVKFNRLTQKKGWLFLLMLRCLPLVPFAMVNLLAGLTTIKTFTFLWVTAVGVIPTGIIFTFAGRQLATINSFSDIFTPSIIGSLVLLMVVVILPVLINRYRKIF